MSTRARRWSDLTQAERDEAHYLIRGEQLMWLVGKNHNWAPEAVPIVRLRYRVLGVALEELKRAARPRKRGK